MSPPQEPMMLGSSFSPVNHAEMNSTSSSMVNEFKLSDLVRSIHDVLGDDGLDAEHIDANKIISLMERYSSNSADWNQYTLFDHSRAYTRNLVDDGNGKVRTDYCCCCCNTAARREKFLINHFLLFSSFSLI